ncbi:hypothetical protein SIAM614_30956 [Roseibium aggregatum IAM 12614]|uniref:Uncharacterized protein n=1 Tax=Roseibium aggregatum (strain ATCC 25650 / DSM 13394 / JCM 20685 / NBRC 16684 / NCIMB 2208 / IAM 12614 / B1) TaxID=384765 RepID=A0NZA3_ROSAI|nr:hypothetical protein SIAM614_30956 [Roseibium aggregatum IAM 12614]
MATAVEDTRVLGAIRKVRLLFHRQGIHICPEPDRPAWTRPFQDADDTGSPDTTRNLDAPAFQEPCNVGRGSFLAKSDLGKFMKIPPDRSEVIGIT